MRLRLGIDLGGTSAKLGLVTAQKKIICERSIKTKGVFDARKIIRDIINEAKHLYKLKAFHKIGVGVAGDIDSQNGIVRVSPNLKWKNVNLKKPLRQVFKKPVLVDNDANVAAWGIYQTQIPKSVRHILVVTLGTGVGGGLIMDGKLHRGFTGSAGEIGHMTVVENGRKCNCGRKGCLEAYAGGKYIVNNVRMQLKNGRKSILQKIYRENPQDITPLVLSRAAKRNDTLAKSVWQEAGSRLGLALGDLIYVFNPEIIVLTGGVAQAGALITQPLKRELRTRPFTTPVASVKIKIAQGARNVGIIGAALNS